MVLAWFAWASPSLAAPPPEESPASPPTPDESPTPPASPPEGALPPPPPEPVAVSPDPEDEPKSPPRRGANLLLAARPLAGNLGLADATFSGGGRPLGGGARESVAFRGSEAGYATPFYFGAEAGLHLLIEHISLGVVAGLGRVIESNAPTARADVTGKVDGASAYFWGGAFGIGGYVWLGPALLRGEVYAGARHISMDLHGYEATLCRTGRNPERLCTEEASATVPMLQPRVSLDVAVLRKTGDGAGALVIGPWVGLDLAPARTLSAGLSIGITSLP